MSVLAQLNEIVSTYQPLHEIIICGDMNASIMQRHGNKQDQALASFLQSLDLKSYQNGKPTFFHENGRDSSEIDYILTKCHSTIFQGPTKVVGKHPLNLSDHVLVSANLNVRHCTKKIDSVSIHVKPKWHKCDLDLFKESVRTHIQQSFLCKHTSSAYDIHCQIRDLTDILKNAAELSIPGYSAIQVKRTKQKSPEVEFSGHCRH